MYVLIYIFPFFHFFWLSTMLLFYFKRLSKFLHLNQYQIHYVVIRIQDFMTLLVIIYQFIRLVNSFHNELSTSHQT